MADQRGQVVHVRGGRCAGGAGDAKNDRVVSGHPNKGGGGPPHADPAEQRADDGEPAGKQGGHSPPRDQAEEPAEEPGGEAPPGQDRRDPSPGQPLKRFGLVREQDRSGGFGGVVPGRELLQPAPCAGRRSAEEEGGEVDRGGRGTGGGRALPKEVEDGRDVGAAAPAAVCGLVGREVGLKRGAGDVRQGSATQPPKGGGELERP